jgi:hypothetical protein
MAGSEKWLGSRGLKNLKSRIEVIAEAKFDLSSRFHLRFSDQVNQKPTGDVNLQRTPLREEGDHSFFIILTSA